MVIASRQNSLENSISPVLQQSDQRLRTIRPIGIYQLHGLAAVRSQSLATTAAEPEGLGTSKDPFTLLAIDAIRGYLLQIDCETDNTTILNPYQVDDFLDASGLALETDATSTTLWFCRENSVYFCDLQDLTPQHFVRLSYPVNGVAVWESTVYVTCQKAGYILALDRTTGRQLDRFSAPGVGIENITVRGDELWVCDRIEQSVYCLDRRTGNVRFRLLTPYEQPTGLTFYPTPEGGDLLYVAYATEESYIRDNPNNPENPLEIVIRDRTFVHPLHFRTCEAERYALSNGYLIEVSYVEELSPLDEVELENLEWRIALPAETPRQTLKHVEPIGLPFTEEIQDGQRVAVFKFKSLKPNEARLFGWKALVEVRGIKYLLTPTEVEAGPELSPELKARYLVDDDELAMDSEVVRRAARVAVGTETNILRKIRKIRDYVYDQLSYGIQPRIDTPDVVLERGVGSCGEYVGVLLALSRLNGIACRTVGRYKCPPHADQHFVPLQPDFNHVWLEFYIPGFGWVPMESNPDDVIERGPYPTRFFMGLPWNHIELGKGIRFETTNFREQGIRLGDLALNHVRFMILGELAAP
jgi:transglutaminase-like putative cysteine protease